MPIFGEISEPSTRTAWEDWDDLSLEPNLMKIAWDHPIEEVNDVQEFLILEGKYLSDCLQQDKISLKPINSIRQVNLHLYKYKYESKYICTVRDYSLVSSSEIVELLKPILQKSINVVAIQIKPLAEYQTSARLNDSCIIRMISSNKFVNNKFKYQNLEQPNLISGVSAGAISMREHLDLSGTAIICYIEIQEEYQIDELHKLLNKLNILQNNKIKPNSFLSSNLYI